MKGYDEIKISPHPHTTLERVLLRGSFLLSDQNSDGSDEKKKPEITPTPSKPSPILDQAVQNKIEAPESLSLKDRITLHQKFFQFLAFLESDIELLLCSQTTISNDLLFLGFYFF